MTLALRAAGITKRYSGVVAVDHVDFELEQGEIHALLGENGAGKTTLMNVLSGLSQADAGEVYLDGDRADIRSPRDAIARGIGMVHQHFMLVPPLTVSENVVLGQECLAPATRRLGPLAFLDRRRARRLVGELSGAFGLAGAAWS